MKRKTIYSILTAVILMGSLIPLQTRAVADMIEWHPSLEEGTVVAWRITDQYLFDSAVPPTLGNHPINLGSVLAFEINDTLPTYYSSAYETGLPPNFLKLFVDFNEVSFFEITDDTEPALALQYMVLPYLFYPASIGGVQNITEFLEYRAASDPNITSISYVVLNSNYVQVSIFNDFIDSFVITVNNNTGIVQNFFIEDDFGEMFGELDIWKADVDDFGTTITNTLNWHPNLVAGTVLSWEITGLTFDPTHEGFIEIAEQNATIGGIFNFKFPNPFPTDPWNYYNPDSFFDVFYEEEPVRWVNMTRAQLIIWLTLTTAQSVTLYNTSIISMSDIHEFRGLMDPEITSTSIIPSGDYLELTIHIESHNEGGGTDDMWVVFDIHTVSGIVQSLSIDIGGVIEMDLEFLESHSSLLIDGSVNSDYPPDDDDSTRTLPGFNWFYLLFSSLIALSIFRRRKK